MKSLSISLETYLIDGCVEDNSISVNSKYTTSVSCVSLKENQYHQILIKLLKIM